MTVPRKVRVGPVRYEILVDAAAIARVERGDKDTLYGYHDPRWQRIILDPDQGADQLADSLLHEILHACVSVTGLDQVLEDREEQVVRTLSTVLLGVVRENPKVLAWLSGNR